MTLHPIHVGWLPTFDEPPQLQTLAADVRPMPVQWRDYASQVAELKLTTDERHEMIEVLQLCERLYGLQRMQSVTQFVLAVLATALVSLNMASDRLARRYGYGHVSLLIGAMLEHRLNIAAIQRRFTRLPLRDDTRNPQFELLDAWTACHLIESWGLLPERSLVYSGLLHTMRSRFGKTGVDQFTLCFTPDEASTVLNITEHLVAIRMQPPAQWRAYVFIRSQRQ